MSVLVLLSGGVDSLTLAAMARKERVLAGCLFYNWGQPAANREVTAAQNWCSRNGVPLLVWRLNLEAREMREGTGPRVVPGRNLAFIAAAIQHAHDFGAGEIWYGATLDDAADYPDCRLGWIHTLNELLLSERVTVRAPFVNKTKAEIVELAGKLGCDVSQAWSCYAPAGDFAMSPCGECNSCKARSAVLPEHQEQHDLAGDD